MVSLVITGAMCFALLGYTAYITNRRKPGSHCHVYGPLYFVAFSIPLILADPMRHVLMDYHVRLHFVFAFDDSSVRNLEDTLCLTMLCLTRFPLQAISDDFSMYRDDCDSETVSCLSVAVRSSLLSS